MNVPFKVTSGKEFEVIYDFLKLSSPAEIQNTIKKHYQTWQNTIEKRYESWQALPYTFFKKERKEKQERNFHL